MNAAASNGVSEILPQDAWAELENNSDAVLIDVRTRSEWAYVGLPDISELQRSVLLIEWRIFPSMSVNESFVDNLMEELGGTVPSKLFFLCRSGIRSLHAADLVVRTLNAQGLNVACYNVAEGFEGDLDDKGHRGTKNGWKVRGLAWRQS